MRSNEWFNYFASFPFHKHPKGRAISIISHVQKNNILREVECLGQGFMVVDPGCEYYDYPKTLYLNNVPYFLTNLRLSEQGSLSHRRGNIRGKIGNRDKELSQ